MGGDVVRIRPVAAYPTMGGRFRNWHRAPLETKPSLRNRTFSLSMAFETVQVSRAPSFSRSVAESVAWVIIGSSSDNRGKSTTKGIPTWQDCSTSITYDGTDLQTHTRRLVFLNKNAGSSTRSVAASVRIGSMDSGRGAQR